VDGAVDRLLGGAWSGAGCPRMGERDKPGEKKWRTVGIIAEKTHGELA